MSIVRIKTSRKTRQKTDILVHVLQCYVITTPNTQKPTALFIRYGTADTQGMSSLNHSN